MATFACPTCGKEVEIPEASQGRSSRCPHCQAEFTVGAPPVPPALQAPPVSQVAVEQGPPRTSGLAIAGFSLSLGGLILSVLASVPALILSIIAITKTGAGRLQGRGLAIAGLVLSIVIPVVQVPVVIAIMAPFLNNIREVARQTACRTNLQLLAQAIESYRVHNDQYPLSLEVLLKEGQPASTMHCPSDNSGRRISYFYLPPAGDDSDAIMACDIAGNHIGLEGDIRNVLYADDHVEILEEEEFQEELALPVNAKFATALRDAEAKIGLHR